MQINKVILLGYVGKDPEIRYLENKTPMAKLSLATTETYKDKNGERVSITEWHSIILWRDLAEITEKYIKKGSEIYIEGKLRTRNWEDKEGTRRHQTEILATHLVLGRHKTTQTETTNDDETEQPAAPQYNIEHEADDLPF